MRHILEVDMEYILIGEVVNTFGIKGELKVKSYTDFNEVRFAKEQTLYIKFHNGYQEVCVHSYREHKGHVLVAFKDLLDINKVEKYIGCEIYVSEDDLHELEDGEYYFRDLVGCKVKLNDEIEVIFGRRHLKVKVLAIKEVVRKNDADILYEVIDEWMDEE